MEIKIFIDSFCKKLLLSKKLFFYYCFSIKSSDYFQNCQFCHSGDNEDKLLLCDSCDRGYHTYCFRPKMDNIPDGDWLVIKITINLKKKTREFFSTMVIFFRYCHECMNKATGERNCIVCGKRVGKNLVLCELCPRAYHTDCHNPVMPKVIWTFKFSKAIILKHYISLC